MRPALISALFVLALVGTALAQQYEHPVYLPMTADGEPTPTATQAPPAPTINPVIPLENGDFEQGAMGWTESPPGIVTALLPINAYSGTQAAFLREINGFYPVLRRDVVIPVFTPYLSYWLWVDTTETDCDEDSGEVVLANAGGNTGFIPLDIYSICRPHLAGMWVNRVLNLSTYAGQTKQISFAVGSGNGLNGTTVIIDDIGWRAGYSDPWFTAYTDTYDCSDFPTWSDANVVYRGNLPGDQNQLDADNDGIPCEALPGAP